MTRFILITLALLSFIPATQAQGFTPLPRLKVQGNHLETKDGTSVTLRGVSLCSLEWHKPLEQIAEVTSKRTGWNANVLRLPVQVQEWKRVGPQNYMKDYLDPAVASCRRNGVYCIIDWHEISSWTDTAKMQELEKFWRIVAPRYAGNPGILYELFNEPTDPRTQNRDNWLAWRTTAQKWVDDIRKAAPNTIILIGSPQWSQMPGFAASDPFHGDNLAYVMHLYPNHAHDRWDDLFGKASATIPLFITEWGWSSKEKNASQVFYGTEESFGKPFKAYLDSKPSINWTAWSYDPQCSPAMQGEDKDMAKFVQDWLDK